MCNTGGIKKHSANNVAPFSRHPRFARILPAGAMNMFHVMQSSQQLLSSVVKINQ